MNQHLKESIALFSRFISDAEETSKNQSDLKKLTLTQLNYLEMIDQLQNPNITELSNALGVQKPSVTIVIERLIQKGCVYKVLSDADRRSSHLHLTETGKLINQRHDHAHKYITEYICQRLNLEEQIQFTYLINKVAAYPLSSEPSMNAID